MIFKTNNLYVFISLFLTLSVFCGCSNSKDDNNQHEILSEINTEFTVSNYSSDNSQKDNMTNTVYIDKLLSDDIYYYTNRTSGGRLCHIGDSIFYSNVFDGHRLYKYDINANEHSRMIDTVDKIQFISVNNNKIWFSGTPVDNNSYPNIYSYDLINKILIREIESAKAPIIFDNYIYYHDIIDDFSCGISRKNMDNEKIESLVENKYCCSDMTMNIADGYIYFHNYVDIYKYNISTSELINITEGKYKNGINKLQLIDKSLYFYTYDNPSAINKIDINGNENEKEILIFNGGNFWYDNLLIAGDYIFFTGRQYTSLNPGEPEENFVTGTFRYNVINREINKIYNRSLGPTLYIGSNYLIALLSAEDNNIDDIIIIDYYGKKIDNISISRENEGNNNPTESVTNNMTAEYKEETLENFENNQEIPEENKIESPAEARYTGKITTLLPNIDGEEAKCIHYNVFDDSFHKISGVLIDYVGASTFDSWLKSKKDGFIPVMEGCSVETDILKFIKDFKIEKEIFEELYYNSIMYYTCDYNIDILYSGDESIINTYYTTRGDYAEMIYRSTDYEIKRNLRNLIGVKAGAWEKEHGYTYCVGWSIPEIIYDFAIPRSDVEKIIEEKVKIINDNIKYLPRSEHIGEDGKIIQEIPLLPEYEVRIDAYKYDLDFIYSEKEYLKSQINNGISEYIIDRMVHSQNESN